VLLLLLYTLQGIPMGLGASLPMLMLERGVSTMEMAVFSIVAFPFAIKLFWAPLVDSIYSARVGRRKTWIVPMQGVIGLLMVFAGGRVDTLLGPAGGPEPVDVRALTKLFLAFYVLAATQVSMRCHPPDARAHPSGLASR
jgi:PAT family acetyl-CoA transporter-like MFS transporter 1